MLRAGLTGNAASGKSSVADAWRAAGAVVIDADVLARDAVAPGTPGLEAIRKRFGPDFINAAGGLDRAAMRRLVFADPDARADLEGIVHPEVARLRKDAEDAAVAAGATLVVHEIPLLYETGLDSEMDLVVLVHAPDEERARRLTELRGLTEAEARSMMAAQIEPAAKLQRADIVIHNDSTLDALEARALQVLRQLRRRAGELPLPNGGS